MKKLTPTALYAWGSPAADFAAKRDAAWFAANPGNTWRVRALIEGESPLADRLVADGTARRIYAVVIYHARAQDRRAKAGHGVYPLLWTRQPTKAALRTEARRIVRHFRVSAAAIPARRAETLAGSGGVAAIPHLESSAHANSRARAANI